MNRDRKTPRRPSGLPPRAKPRPMSSKAPVRASSKTPARTSSKAPAPADAPPSGSEQAPDDVLRLQKFLAHAGVGSRRKCEELIAAGRVTVDGRTVTELGSKVRAGQDVRVDGDSLTPARMAYYLVNKPTGVVSTNYDQSGRPRVIDLLPATNERLFTVGRLDMSSEGLILVTNDGELANRLAHPRYEVDKTYHVLVAGKPTPEVLDTLRRGVYLAEGRARVSGVRFKKALKQSTLLEIVLQEGKNREIRRILARVGHKVLRLKRVALANLRLGTLVTGEFRRLTPDELKQLRRYRPGQMQRPAFGSGGSRGKLRRLKGRAPKPAAGSASAPSTAPVETGGAPRDAATRPRRQKFRPAGSRGRGEGFRPERGAGTAVRPPRKAARKGKRR